MSQLNPQVTSGDKYTPIAREKTSKGCRTGCIFIVGLLLVPYVVNLLLTLIPSFVNQSKWATNGSSSYAITANDNVHNYYQGENIVTVKDGKVIAVKNARTVEDQDLKDYYRFTIDGLFSGIYTCAFLFPLNWCTNEYEPHYGYPTKLEINCPIDILCQTNITVTKVELASP